MKNLTHEIAIKEIEEMLAEAEAKEFCEGGCSYKKWFCRCTTPAHLLVVKAPASSTEICDGCERIQSSCRC